MNIRYLGLQPYTNVWEAMKTFTTSRTSETPDEIWILEHPPVYTQGQAGKPEHMLMPNHIPMIQTDRGGQITYHGPGQLIAYVLLDLNRRQLSIRTLVCHLELCLIELLRTFNMTGTQRCKAPGVYVEEKKIASIGLRVRKSCTYHGIALNVNMDLSPFHSINPCGYSHLEMTQMSFYRPNINVETVIPILSDQFLTQFGV